MTFSAVEKINKIVAETETAPSKEVRRVVLLGLRASLLIKLDEIKDTNTSKERLEELKGELKSLKVRIEDAASINKERIVAAMKKIVMSALASSPNLNPEERNGMLIKAESVFKDPVLYPVKLQDAINNGPGFEKYSIKDKETDTLPLQFFDSTSEKSFNFPGSVENIVFYEQTKPLLICGQEDKKYKAWLEGETGQEVGSEPISLKIKYALKYADDRGMMLASADYLTWLNETSKVPSPIANLRCHVIAPNTFIYETDVKSFTVPTYTPFTGNFDLIGFKEIQLKRETAAANPRNEFKIILLPLPKEIKAKK